MSMIKQGHILGGAHRGQTDGSLREKEASIIRRAALPESWKMRAILRELHALSNEDELSRRILTNREVSSAWFPVAYKRAFLTGPQYSKLEDLDKRRYFDLTDDWKYRLKWEPSDIIEFQRLVSPNFGEIPLLMTTQARDTPVGWKLLVHITDLGQRVIQVCR